MAHQPRPLHLAAGGGKDGGGQAAGETMRELSPADADVVLVAGGVRCAALCLQIRIGFGGHWLELSRVPASGPPPSRGARLLRKRAHARTCTHGSSVANGWTASALSGWWGPLCLHFLRLSLEAGAKEQQSCHIASRLQCAPWQTLNRKRGVGCLSRTGWQVGVPGCASSRL